MSCLGLGVGDGCPTEIFEQVGCGSLVLKPAQGEGTGRRLFKGLLLVQMSGLLISYFRTLYE